MPTATCRFSDGESFTFDADPDALFLDAALAAGVPILHQCRSGSCGTCVCTSEQQALTMPRSTATCLLQTEVAQGRRLSCVGQLQADDTLSFDYPSTQTGPARASAFVDAIDWLADDVVRLRAELAEGDWLTFDPGQFLMLTPPGETEGRRYSLSSTPGQLPMLEFLIRVLPQGLVSDYLRERAAVDDVITLTGSYGSFRWRKDLSRPHIFVAGGTGLAPILSILDDLRSRSGKKPPLLLCFGCTSPETRFGAEEVALRADWMPTLTVRRTLETGAQAGEIAGDPVAVIDQADVSKESCAYLCGPPPMIAAATARLLELGVAAERIYAEQFTAALQSETLTEE